MKNLSLTLQIWLLSAAVTLSLSLLILLFMPGMLQQFFTQQVLNLLEDSQKNLQIGVVKVEETSTLPNFTIKTGEHIPITAPVDIATLTITSDIAASELTESSPPVTVVLSESPSLSRASIPFINHVYFSDTVPLSEDLVPEPFLGKIEQEAAIQSEMTQKYTQVENDRTLLYVIKKTSGDGGSGKLLSYSWGTYRNELAGGLYRKLMLLMIAAMVISWVPSWLVSRHLTRPLVAIENHVLKIGSKDWFEPLTLNRRDEIGRLALAFENMRERLVRQDQAQQTYLQNISHSLKTPLMVIQSYTKAILDGIYPKGDLTSSLLIIKKEAEHTNRLVQDLVLLNKINYLSTREIKSESVSMPRLISEIADKLKSRRPELQWEIELSDFSLMGDEDQWKIVVENLLDNATRYALSTIQIIQRSGQDETAGWWLRIWNDGIPIDENYQVKIFEPYCTGQGGQSGLGLAIVKHIIDLAGRKVWAENEEGGVAFYIA